VKLSIVIVSWNVKEYLVSCLRSIEENGPNHEFEIIVVDNASADGSVDAVRDSFPQVDVIANKDNRGFAAANNQGIEKSQGQYLLLLNPDTIVHPGSLDILIKFMDYDKDVGACGPKLLNEDRTTQRSVRRFPTFRAALYRHTIFRRIGLFRRQYKRWLMKDFSYDTQTELDQLMGAALMVRRSVMDQVGWMDERFFMYYEEVDFCYRVKKAGWRVVFVPAAMITHFGGRSSAQIPVENSAMFLTSMLKFFRKNRGVFVTGLFDILFKPAVVLKYINNIVVGLLTYVLATLLFDQRRQDKAVKKIKNSTSWLRKYFWQLLFKM
jgi:hypothetical protein